METQLHLPLDLPSGNTWACRDPLRTWWLHGLNLFRKPLYGKPTQWPPVLTPCRGSLPAQYRIQSLATYNYSSPFIDLRLNVEMFLDAGDPQRSICLLYSHITARPTCMSRGWRLLKSTRYWRCSSALVRTEWLVPDLVGTCACYCAVYFSTLMVILSFWFCFPFFTRCNMKWRWFRLWAVSWLPISHQGCAAPWLLSASITDWFWWCICATLQIFNWEKKTLFHCQQIWQTTVVWC